MVDFETELDRAGTQGVLLQENLPFLLKPESQNGKAALLIHGFGGSPYEMRPVGEHLCKRGYLVLGVRLEGHGSKPEDLQRCRWQDWFGSVERGYALLQKTGLPLELIGQSTGALLALKLAHVRPIQHLILLSPFLKLRHPLASIAGLLKYIIPFQQRKLPYPQSRHYYEHRPLSGIEQIELLRDVAVMTLPQLKLPTLIMSAEGDQTVAPGTGLKLFETLESTDKEFHLFGPEVPHVLSTAENPRLNEVLHLIDNFLIRTPQASNARHS